MVWKSPWSADSGMGDGKVLFQIGPLKQSVIALSYRHLPERKRSILAQKCFGCFNGHLRNLNGALGISALARTRGNPMSIRL